MDQITAKFMAFRYKQCLDCMIPELDIGDPEEQRAKCALCNDFLCRNCFGSITNIIKALREEEFMQASGMEIIQLV